MVRVALHYHPICFASPGGMYSKLQYRAQLKGYRKYKAQLKEYRWYSNLQLQKPSKVLMEYRGISITLFESIVKERACKTTHFEG